MGEKSSWQHVKKVFFVIEGEEEGRFRTKRFKSHLRGCGLGRVNWKLNVSALLCPYFGTCDQNAL